MITEYFAPQTNIAYEVYNFRQARQNQGESLDSYHVRLRQLAKTCDFTDIDKEIKEHIILSCTSTTLRRRALQDEYSLDKLLKVGRSLEISESQARHLEGRDQARYLEEKDRTVNSVRGRNRSYQARRNYSSRENKPPTHFNKKNFHTYKQSKDPSQTCRNCGGYFPHKQVCPAKNKDCRACGKRGHFARVCRTNPLKPKPVNAVAPSLDKHQPNNDEEEYKYVYTVSKSPDCPPTCLIEIEGQRLDIMIDTGASVNLIDETTYRKINRHRGRRLEKAERYIYSYGSSAPLPILGTFVTTIKTSDVSTIAKLHVVKGNFGNLLSCATAKQLNLLQVSINAVDAPRPGDLQQEYKCLFGGIGKVKGRLIKLHIDPQVKPKQQPHRRIPFHVRKDVEKELERLEKLDIIEKVDGPTPWVSPIVVVPKDSGEVRICVDMREANRAVKREKHLMPTMDDLIADLNGATVFSKLDLSSGYHQFELSPESRNITTFSTHVGLRRYKRLLFGINAAAEIFQNAIEEILTGLPGCKNISDDIIVFGKDQKEHDANLRGVLERLKQYNIRLKEEKCSFSQPKIMFYGHIFTAEGIKPDPKKVDVIKAMNSPQCASEVKSLLGMAQYVSRFIPDYAKITAPLRNLTKQGVDWRWTKEEQKALDSLKEALAGDKVMTYFDPRKKTEIVVDASPVGLGGLLMQEGKVVSYASRSLSEVEARYSQTEREMLAVVWAAEHFHLYVYGSKFHIITDHKPLLGIFNGNKPTSTRIDRWKLRLMPYDCQLSYRPGRNEENPADFISRHPNASKVQEQNVAEEYTNYVCINAIPKAMTIQEVEVETQKDPTMQAVIKAIETGNWSSPEVQEYTKIKQELAVHKGTILRGNRLVIPPTLRNKAVDLAHVGHQGIVKTKRLLREKVWFPGIDKLTEEKITNCHPCQASTPESSKLSEPLKMTPLPIGPWKEVSIDFAGPYPSGEYIMVVIDEYSRFPEVEILTSTSARAVIPKLDAILSRQGIPDVLKSDNGPPFTSLEFKKFAEHMGFQHRRITPYWPKSNGEVERFMRTIGKSIRSANVEARNWKQDLYKFLRQYRATPHSTTGISPCEALNRRRLKTTLPESDHPSIMYDDLPSKMKRRDAEQKSKMKLYADNKSRAREGSLNPGMVVLMRQPQQNKLSTPFDPNPFVVKEKKGTMVTVSNDYKTVTRNSSHFKVISPELLNPERNQKRQENEVPPPIANPSQDEATESLRRSNRQRRPPAKFTDYVTTIY